MIQQPKVIGRATIGAIAEHFAGKDVAQVVLIPCELYTREKALEGK